MATKAKETQVDGGWEQVSAEEGAPWTPTEKGDKLIGRYESLEVAHDPSGNNGEGRDFNIYKIRTEEGLRAVYGTYKLDKAFEKISIGNDVFMEYMGKIDISGGQSMNDFKVATRVPQS